MSECNGYSFKSDDRFKCTLAEQERAGAGFRDIKRDDPILSKEPKTLEGNVFNPNGLYSQDLCRREKGQLQLHA